MNRRKALTTLASAGAVAPLLLDLAACGASTSHASAAPAPPTTRTGQPATVGVASTGLGQILVDAQGRTLYLFQKDTGMTSTCTGACAAAWPPLRAAGQPVVGWDDQDSGLVVEGRHVQPVGRDLQPGHHRVNAVAQQRRGRLIAGQVQGVHVGAGVPVAQLPHCGGDQQGRRVPDGDPAGPGGPPGRRDGCGGRSQQCLGLWQEDLAGLGKPAAARGAVDEAGADLLLKCAYTQSRIRQMILGGAVITSAPILAASRTWTGWRTLATRISVPKS